MSQHHRPSVFLTRKLPDRVMERLNREVDLEYNREDRDLEKDELIRAVRGREGLVTTVSNPVDRQVIEAADRLKVISNYAVGYNNIDLEAASEHGIAVTNTPGVLTDATADLAFSLILAAARRVVEADRFVRTGRWRGWAPEQFLGRQVSGAVLGIVGFGRIGRAVARRGECFGMKRIYWNRTRLDESEETSLGVTWRPFDKLLQEVDFLSVNIAYTSDTHHLIGRDELSAMKSTSILVNTARGAVIDEKALVEALRGEQIAGAGLDVYEKEPAIEPELLKMDRVVLLPHLGSATYETRERMGMIAIDNLMAVVRGDAVPNMVNRPE